MTNFFLMSGHRAPRKDSIDIDIGKSPLFIPKSALFEHPFSEEKTPIISKHNSEEKEAKPGVFEKPLQKTHPHVLEPFVLEPASSGKEESLSSYFLNVLPVMRDHNWNIIQTKKHKLKELVQEFDIAKHIENLVYLEENNEKKLKETFGSVYNSLLKQLVQIE